MFFDDMMNNIYNILIINKIYSHQSVIKRSSNQKFDDSKE